jgi:hypothetical protein
MNFSLHEHREHWSILYLIAAIVYEGLGLGYQEKIIKKILSWKVCIWAFGVVAIILSIKLPGEIKSDPLWCPREVGLYPRVWNLWQDDAVCLLTKISRYISFIGNGFVYQSKHRVGSRLHCKHLQLHVLCHACSVPGSMAPVLYIEHMK